MNDYIVLVDEKGQPYIAHRRGQLITNLKEGSKSVAKVVDGVKTRYFKTQEEVKAYLNEGKKKAGKAVDKATKAIKDKTGITAKKEYQSAVKRFNDASRNKKNVEKELSKSVYDRSLAKTAYDSSKRVADARKKVYDVEKDDFINKAERFLTGKNNKYEQKVYDEWVEAQGKAADKAVTLNKANRNLYSDLSSAAKAGIEYNKAYNEVEKAKEKYKNTPLSKIEDFVSRSKVGEVVDKAKGAASSVSDKAKDIADSAKEKAGQVADKAKGAVSSVSDKAKDIAGSAKEKAGQAVDKAKEKVKDKLGYDERERRDAANKAYEDNEKRYSSGVDERKAHQAYKELVSYTAKMNDRYGPDWQNMMSDTEKKKYAGLVKKDEETSEAWHDVFENRYSHVWGESDTLKDKKNKADADYYNTPLGRLESFKEDASEVVDKAKDVATSAADKAKEAAGSVADKAKGAASSVKSSYDRMKDEFHDKKVEKEVKKSADSYEKWKKENTRPKDNNIFTVNKATGESSRKNQIYDWYIEQIDSIYSEISSRPNMSDAERKQKLRYAEILMDDATHYADHK